MDAHVAGMPVLSQGVQCLWITESEERDVFQGLAWEYRA